MKITFSLIYLFLFFSYYKTDAQAKSDTSLKLQDIQLTNAPAFSLMDVSPSSIESPSTTKAFAASILNGLNQSNGIPQNYAIEFTPYWFYPHRNSTNYKYFGVNEKGKSIPFSQLQFYQLSFALVNKDSATNIGQLTNHNVSFGIRTTLIRIFKKSTRQRIYSLTENWHNKQQIILGILNGDTPTKAQMDSISNTLKYSDTIKNYLTEKPLFSLDAAAAENYSFNNNSFNSNRLSRSGIWLNANISLDLNPKKPANNYLTFSFLGRYMYQNDSLNAQGNYIKNNAVDFGLKTEFQAGNISFAYEYIYRSNSNKSLGNTYKSVGLIHYKIKDGLFLTGAFGQNFSNVNNLIASIGINWGISNGNETIK